MLSDYPYYCFEKELPKEFCDGIVKLGKALAVSSASLHDRETSFSTYDPSVRNNKISWISNKEVIDILQTYVQVANRNAGWNFDVMAYETPQFSEYDSEQFYDWHIDMGVESATDVVVRKLSLSVALNDDFEGGDFEIEKWCSPAEKDRVIKVKEMRTAGSIIVFPSFIQHRVTPVTKGKRYSLVCWFRGPDFC